MHGHARGPFELVDLDGVLADVREDLQVRIEEYDAEVTADELPQAHGDAGQLLQVFQNLMDNAIEYSGERATFSFTLPAEDAHAE